jgi:hypothetical protein
MTEEQKSLIIEILRDDADIDDLLDIAHIVLVYHLNNLRYCGDPIRIGDVVDFPSEVRAVAILKILDAF